MARSWEYSRQRRIAMQVAMWVILGLTLALAGLVSRQKRQDLKIPLSQPIAVGDLMVRLPRGWHYRLFRADDVLGIRGEEPGDQIQRPVRTIQVRQQRLTESAMSAEEYLSMSVLNADLHHVAPMRFSGLNSDGISAEIEVQNEDDSVPAATPPSMYAATVTPLPDGHRLAVVVLMEDPALFTPADDDALRQIADAIALAPK